MFSNCTLGIYGLSIDNGEHSGIAMSFLTSNIYFSSFWCDACGKKQARGRVLCLDCYDAAIVELCPELQCIDASDRIAEKTNTRHCPDHLLLKHRDNLLLMDYHSTIEQARECLQIAQRNYFLNYQSIDSTLQPPVSRVKSGTLGDEVSISDSETRRKHNCIVCHDAVPFPCWYCIECCQICESEPFYFRLSMTQNFSR